MVRYEAEKRACCLCLSYQMLLQIPDGAESRRGQRKKLARKLQKNVSRLLKKDLGELLLGRECCLFSLCLWPPFCSPVVAVGPSLKSFPLLVEGGGVTNPFPGWQGCAPRFLSFGRGGRNSKRGCVCPWLTQYSASLSSVKKKKDFNFNP